MHLERLYPIWFVLCAAAGAATGHFTGQGAVAGLVAGMLVAALPLLALVVALALWMRWRPDLPTCRCGQCKARDYRYVAPDEGDRAGRPVRFSCPRCGRLYALSGGRLDEITSDGRAIPFFYHTKWGRWRKAGAASSA